MCDQLLNRAKVMDLLMGAGLTAWRARLVIDRELRPHPHQLHQRRLYLRSTVKSWLDKRLSGAQAGNAVPWGESIQPSGEPASPT